LKGDFLYLFLHHPNNKDLARQSKSCNLNNTLRNMLRNVLGAIIRRNQKN